MPENPDHQTPAPGTITPDASGATASGPQAGRRLPVRRALISVSDKDGLLDLGRALAAHGAEILSTGGSARALREAGIAVVEIADHTGFPEILDGRVKTLVPKVHGGILGRRDLPDHLAQMAEHGIAPIDLVCVNLYPFEATVARGALFDDCVENIDIGGPALIRAAAKNHGDVTILTDPGQYAGLIAALSDGGTTLDQRRRHAASAYARTSAYDAAIAAWFAQEAGEAFPARMTISGTLQSTLRYGENPHQQAAFYTLPPTRGTKAEVEPVAARPGVEPVAARPGVEPAAARPGVATARQVQGKSLSYNNLNDTDAAFEAVAEFDAPAVVIVKHANPCGVAQGESIAQAWDAALACDPVSAFGGIVALNRTLDGETAARIAGIFTEVIVAPDAAPAAIEALARKKNLRLLLTGAVPDPAEPGLTLRTLAGGFLVQTRDNGRVTREDLRCVTRRQPTQAELDDLLFAFRVAKHVKSNAVIYVRGGATVGIGAGQMSRVDSARIAARKSEDAARALGTGPALTIGSVAASDAFFPFADGLESVVAAGATAVIQPGGSLRDQEVIDAADRAGIAMVFTGMRHFRH